MDDKCSFNLSHFLTQLKHFYMDTIKDISTYGRTLFTFIVNNFAKISIYCRRFPFSMGTDENFSIYAKKDRPMNNNMVSNI